MAETWKPLQTFIKTNSLNAHLQVNVQKIMKSGVNSTQRCQRTWHNISEMPYNEKAVDLFSLG